MKITRTRMALAVAGLLLAGTAQAATLSVYARMGGGVPTGAAAYAIGSVTPVVPADTTINCSTNSAAGCVDSAVVAATVQLTANQVTDAEFVSWSGCNAVAGNVCTVNMTGNKTVAATFKPALFQLNAKTYPVLTAPPISPYGGTLTAATEAVRNAGEAVVAAPLSCQTGAAGTTCSGFVPNGAANFVITAVPNALSVVSNWTGCSSFTATTCTIAAMTGPKAISATFGPRNIPITAQVMGNGTVSTTGLPDNMSCTSAAGADCTAGVASGGNVTLTAAAASGSTFMGWTGACTGAATTCALTAVTSAKAVTATFKSSACTSCHGVPPSTHVGTLAATCSNCHTNYTSGTVNPATHMDGTATATWNRTEPPASFGLQFEILSATTGDGTTTKPTVTFKAKDAAGTAIDVIAGVGTGGIFCQSSTSCSGIPRFMFGEIQPDGSFLTKLGTTANVTSDTIAAARLVDNHDGSFTYTFLNLLGRPSRDFDRLYRLTVFGATYFKRADGSYVMFPGYGRYDYVPNGGAGTTAPAMTVSDAACDDCHGGLQLHGRRRGVQTCLTCHNINTPLGTGNTDAFKWDLKNLAHKLHSGKNYTGVRPDGATGSAWGTTFDASTMAMGPSHTTYFEAGSPAPATTVVDPGIMGKECGVCHQGTGAARAYTNPTRFACGSCHDAVNFTTGTGHGPTNLAQADDSFCTGCHPEANVRLVHSPFYETGNDVNFTSLTNWPAGGHVLQISTTAVTVDASGRPTFTIQASYKDGTGAMVAAPLNTWAATTVDADNAFKLPTCAFTVAGPTSDYTLPATGGTTVGCTAAGATTTGLVATATPGEFTVSQLGTTGFFSGKTGAYTIGFEIMMTRVKAASVGYVRKPTAAKPNFVTIYRAATTDAWQTSVRGSGEPLDLTQSRRAVVSFDKCNNCHVQIGFHSNRGRQGPDYCAECHNPKLDNGGRVRFNVTETDTGAIGGKVLPESVSMNVFIHRIHMGDALPSVEVPANASPLAAFPGEIKYGSNRTASDPTPGAEGMADFTFFAMPSPMGRCDQCHISAGAVQTWALNERSGQAPVERTYRSCDGVDASGWCTGRTAGTKVITPPMKAACTSCHDDAATNSHADAFTISPMSATAVERCAECHGAGKALDSLNVHEVIP